MTTNRYKQAQNYHKEMQNNHKETQTISLKTKLIDAHSFIPQLQLEVDSGFNFHPRDHFVRIEFHISNVVGITFFEMNFSWAVIEKSKVAAADASALLLWRRVSRRWRCGAGKAPSRTMSAKVSSSLWRALFTLVKTQFALNIRFQAHIQFKQLTCYSPKATFHQSWK